jgi:hypothetical protein
MKNNMVFGLLALAMLASVAFADHPDDYNNYIRTGGAMRYVGPAVDGPVLVFPQGQFEEYQAFDNYYATQNPDYVSGECYGKVNGVCPA